MKCENCGKKAIYECGDCGTLYCEECAEIDGFECECIVYQNIVRIKE